MKSRILFLVACLTTFRGYTQEGNWTEERWIEGVVVTTADAHNVMAGEGCEKPNGSEWCHYPYRLVITTPNDHWVFVGEPKPDVTRDNQGSTAWNCVGCPGKWFVVENNPHKIVVRALIGSRSIDLRAKCLARYYP